MIHFSCPGCGKKFQVKEEFAGRGLTCPQCKGPLVVPPPLAVPVAAPGPPSPARGEGENRGNRRGRA